MQMLAFCIPVTISELVLTLAVAGGPSISSTKAIADSAGLGAVDLLCVFGIRNKNEKKQLRTGDSIPRFLFGFSWLRRALPSALGIQSARTTTELPVLLTENDNCQAARMIIRTGAFGGIP